MDRDTRSAGRHSGVAWRWCVGAAAAALLLAAGAGAQCTPQWDTSFGVPQLTGGSGFVVDVINTSVMYDDGTGPALYVGGSFRTIDGTLAQSIAKFDGNRWTALGDGVWHSFVNPFDNQPGVVYALEVFDPDGPGPQRAVLVVGGDFATVDGNRVASPGIATWDGQAWGVLSIGLAGRNSNPLAGPTSHEFYPVVFAIEAFDAGNGEQLYVGGALRTGVNDFDTGVSGIAVWDGSTWGPVGATGIGSSHIVTPGRDSGEVRTLMAFNDGSGPALYVGGDFANVFGVVGSENLARWDGEAWNSVGGGRPGSFAVTEFVLFDDDGAGPMGERLHALTADRTITNPGDSTVSLLTWTGTNWNSTAVPRQRVATFQTGAIVFDDGTGPALYIAGNASEVHFPDFGPQLIRYNGSTFTELGDVNNQVSGEFFTHVGIANLGGVNRLFVSGRIEGTAAAPTTGLLVWTGTTWTTFGNFGGLVNGLDPNGMTIQQDFSRTTFDTFDADGSGPGLPKLITSGGFSYLGGALRNGPGGERLIVRDGTNWVDMGPPFPSGAMSRKFAVGHHPTGDRVYMPVEYTYPSANPELSARGTRVYQLVGNTWTLLGTSQGFTGSGLDQFGQPRPGVVHSLIEADLGFGRQLFAFGSFTLVDGQPIQEGAVWNGTSWAPIGSGLPVTGIAEGFASPSVVALNDGAGMAIYYAAFDSSDVLKWDGSTWTHIGQGLPTAYPPISDCIGNFPGAELIAMGGNLYAWIGGTGSLLDDGLFCTPFFLDGELYQRNNGAWVLINGAPATGFREANFAGVVNSEAGERMLFTVTGDVSVDLIPQHYTVAEFDGEAFSPRSDLGNFVGVLSFQQSLEVQSVQESNGSYSVWFSGPFEGVGGVFPEGSTTTLNAISSGRIARWYCPASPCPADFNHSGNVTVQDIFDFLAAWFAGNTSADINHVGGVTVQDIFDFLSAWFAGC